LVDNECQTVRGFLLTLRSKSVTGNNRKTHLNISVSRLLMDNPVFLSSKLSAFDWSINLNHYRTKVTAVAFLGAAHQRSGDSQPDQLGCFAQEQRVESSRNLQTVADDNWHFAAVLFLFIFKGVEGRWDPAPSDYPSGRGKELNREPAG
jgi:hypothetical protein